MIAFFKIIITIGYSIERIIIIIVDPIAYSKLLLADFLIRENYVNMLHWGIIKENIT